MKSCLKAFSTSQATAGFTLIELLVAMAVSTLVIAVAGFGLVTILDKNNKAEAETLRRTNLNRGLDFIADDIRMASIVSNIAPTLPVAWASSWNLGGGSPEAKLYLQIPSSVASMTASNDQVTVTKHGLSAGNAVMFTIPAGQTGTIAAGVSPNVKYYVTGGSNAPTADTFKVSTTLAYAASGTAVDLTSDSSGSLMANQLIIYYVRDNTNTWLGPKTINRSAGDCSSPYQASNCPVLLDLIASSGFTATLLSSRQVTLSLQAQTCTSTCTNPQTTIVSTKTFARSAP